MTTFNPFSLAGKRILVTGASSGLGYAIALGCANMGAESIGVGRDAERLAGTKTALEAISPLAHQMLQADLTNAADRASLITAIAQPIHGVVHSAGISRLSPVRMIREEHLREV